MTSPSGLSGADAIGLGTGAAAEPEAASAVVDEVPGVVDATLRDVSSTTGLGFGTGIGSGGFAFSFGLSTRGGGLYTPLAGTLVLAPRPVLLYWFPSAPAPHEAKPVPGQLLRLTLPLGPLPSSAIPHGPQLPQFPLLPSVYCLRAACLACLALSGLHSFVA